MARTTFSEENRTGDGGDKFPRLKLETGETAMFMMPELPWKEWVHELRAIKVDNGVGVRKVKTKRNGEQYDDWDYDFVGRPICLGDSEELKNHGVDAKNCPACAAGHSPTQRFAVNIVRYELVGNAPRVPFGAKILIWSFTARMYDELLDLAKGIGDLRQHDLILKCEDGFWQRNKLAFSQNAYALNNQDAFSFVKQLLAGPGNKATEEQLREACGRRRTRDQIIEDVSLIERRARQANSAGVSQQGDPTGGATPGGGADLGSSLDKLNEMAGPQGSGDPFAAGQQEGWGSLPNTQPATAANPGVGGFGEFGGQNPAPEPANQAQNVAAQADNLFGQQADPFAGASTATPATTTGTAAPAAVGPSPTAPTAAQSAPGQADPFASAPPSATAPTTSAASPASPSAGQSADPFAQGSPGPTAGTPSATIASSAPAASQPPQAAVPPSNGDPFSGAAPAATQPTVAPAGESKSFDELLNGI